jgi:hypothetical protein
MCCVCYNYSWLPENAYEMRVTKWSIAVGGLCVPRHATYICGLITDVLSSHLIFKRHHPLSWRMASSGMLCRVVLVRTDVSGELSASIIRIRFGELRIMSPVTSNWRTLEALSSFETSVLARATQRNNPEDAILHSHRRENLKSYIHCHVALIATCWIVGNEKLTLYIIVCVSMSILSWSDK